MLLTTCNPKLDEVIFESNNTKFIVYGIAGSGKTNFLLNLIKCSQHKNTIVFISTEGSSVINRVSSLNIESENVYFSTALSQEHLISLILDSLSLNPSIIIIDSLNYLYRVELSRDKKSIAFPGLLTLLDTITKRGIIIFGSAQVYFDEDSGRTLPSGFEYLELWSDVIIEIEILNNRTRAIKFVKPSIAKTFRFVITSNGIYWL